MIEAIFKGYKQQQISLKLSPLSYKSTVSSEVHSHTCAQAWGERAHRRYHTIWHPHSQSDSSRVQQCPTSASLSLNGPHHDTAQPEWFITYRRKGHAQCGVQHRPTSLSLNSDFRHSQNIYSKKFLKSQIWGVVHRPLDRYVLSLPACRCGIGQLFHNNHPKMALNCLVMVTWILPWSIKASESVFISYLFT